MWIHPQFCEVRATATCPALGKKVAENDPIWIDFNGFWCDEFSYPVAIGLVSRGKKTGNSLQYPEISLNFTPESKCWNQEVSTKFSALSSFGASHFPSHFSVLFVEWNHRPWSAPLLPPRELWWRKPSELVTRFSGKWSKLWRESSKIYGKMKLETEREWNWRYTF